MQLNLKRIFTKGASMFVALFLVVSLAVVFAPVIFAEEGGASPEASFDESGALPALPGEAHAFDNTLQFWRNDLDETGGWAVWQTVQVPNGEGAEAPSWQLPEGSSLAGWTLQPADDPAQTPELFDFTAIYTEAQTTFDLYPVIVSAAEPAPEAEPPLGRGGFAPMAVLTITVGSGEVFMNGNPVKIYMSGGVPVLESLANAADTFNYEDGSGNPASWPLDLSNYTIYGGAHTGDLAGGTHLELNGITATAVYGGSKSGGITGSITLSIIDCSIKTTVAGGSVDGDITGNIAVLVARLNVGGTRVTAIWGGSINGTVDTSTSTITTTGAITGSITLEIYNSSATLVWGASAVGDVYGDVHVHVNCCPTHGESGTCPATCPNHAYTGAPNARDSFRQIYGGGGDNGYSTQYITWRDYANVYGNTKLAIAGNSYLENGSSMPARLSAGGRQGAVRAHNGAGGNASLFLGGNFTTAPGSNGCYITAAGYYTPTMFPVEGDMSLVIDGNVDIGTLYAGAESGTVGGTITTEVKNAKHIAILGAATLSEGWGFDGTDPARYDKAVLTVHNTATGAGEGIENLLVTQNGAVQHSIINVLGGKVGRIAAANSSAALLLDNTVNISGGTVDHVYNGGRKALDGKISTVKSGVVNVTGGKVGSIYNGGRNAETLVEKASVNIYTGANVDYIFNSSYEGDNGAANTLQKVTVYGGAIDTIYNSGYAAAAAQNPVVEIIDGTIDALVGGYLGAVRGTSTYIIKGGTLNEVYGGAFEGVTIASVNISISGGDIGALYGGGIAYGNTSLGNSVVTNLLLTITGGTLNDVYLGGETVAGAADTTAVANATLHMRGGTVTSNIIHANGTTPADTVANPMIYVYRTASLAYWFFLDDASLANAKLHIIPREDVASYGVIEVTDPVAVNMYNYLYPYKLHKNAPTPPNPPAAYTVTYNGNGNTGGTVPAAASYTAGTGVTVAAGVTRSGRNFLCWRSSHDGVLYAPGQTFAMPAGNVILNAQWSGTPASTTLQVRFFDHDGTQIGATQTVPYGSDAAPPADPTRDGYTFTGWDKSYKNITQDTDIYAQYTAGESAGSESEPGVTAIAPTPPPAAGGASWSLLSLILSVAALGVGMFRSFSAFSNKEQNGEADAEEESDQNRWTAGRAFAVAFSLLPGVLFLILDNLRNPMAFVNRWTLYVAIAFILFAGVNVLQKALGDKKEQEEEYSPAS